MILCFLMAVAMNSGIVAFYEEDDKGFYLIKCVALPLLTFVGISSLSGYIPELAIAGLLVSIATIFCSFFFSWLSFNAESYYDSYPASFSMIQTLTNAGADLNMRFHSCYLRHRDKKIQIKLPLFEYFKYFLFLKKKTKMDKKTEQLKSETAAGTIIKDIISDYVHEQKQEADNYINKAKQEIENIKKGTGLRSLSCSFDEPNPCIIHIDTRLDARRIDSEYISVRDKDYVPTFITDTTYGKAQMLKDNGYKSVFWKYKTATCSYISGVKGTSIIEIEITALNI